MRTWTPVRRKSVPAPQVQASDEDIIYFAGLFDGEGCIGSTVPKSGWPCICLDVGQSKREVLDWIQERWSGRVRLGKNAFHWHIQSQAEVEAVLLSLLPYLKVKKQEAIIALQMLAEPRLSKEELIALHLELKSLKVRD
jgi:hypothetical protein